MKNTLYAHLMGVLLSITTSQAMDWDQWDKNFEKSLQQNTRQFAETSRQFHQDFNQRRQEFRQEWEQHDREFKETSRQFHQHFNQALQDHNVLFNAMQSNAFTGFPSLLQPQPIQRTSELTFTSPSRDPRPSYGVVSGSSVASVKKDPTPSRVIQELKKDDSSSSVGAKPTFSLGTSPKPVEKKDSDSSEPKKPTSRQTTPPSKGSEGGEGDNAPQIMTLVVSEAKVEKKQDVVTSPVIVTRAVRPFPTSPQTGGYNPAPTPEVKSVTTSVSVRPQPVPTTSPVLMNELLNSTAFKRRQAQNHDADDLHKRLEEDRRRQQEQQRLEEDRRRQQEQQRLEEDRRRQQEQQRLEENRRRQQEQQRLEEDQRHVIEYPSYNTYPHYTYDSYSNHTHNQSRNKNHLYL